ncbi:MAG: hypothetical protein AB1449_11795 [Chloroflexota bacterium]
MAKSNDGCEGVATAMRRGKVRVRGLVRLMNLVRRQLAAGPPLAEAAALERQVRQALESLLQECRAHGLTPTDLPVPSQRAFEFLSSLDFGQVRLPATPASRQQDRLRLTHWIRYKDSIQRRLTALARKHLGQPAEEIAPERVAALRVELLEAVADVAERCERAGTSPALLPGPSRRAYQWMSFLAEPGNLEGHVETLALALGVDSRLTVDFYHLSALYRVTRNADRIHLVASEAFVGAPQPVIRALVKVALPHTRKALHRGRIEDYVESDSFQEALLALEMSGGACALESRGLVYDLEAVFDRVNTQYFGGAMARPRLAWNQAITGREFGHYQHSSDTVVLSIALDSPKVPVFVVEHVMHHELLHKKLGAPRVNGRRQAHTAEFRRQERRFARFEEADQFLKALAAGKVPMGCGEADAALLRRRGGEREAAD